MIGMKVNDTRDNEPGSKDEAMYCHDTDGPPKIGPPGPSAAKYVAVDGPPDQVRLP